MTFGSVARWVERGVVFAAGLMLGAGLTGGACRVLLERPEHVVLREIDLRGRIQPAPPIGGPLLAGARYELHGHKGSLEYICVHMTVPKGAIESRRVR